MRLENKIHFYMIRNVEHECLAHLSLIMSTYINGCVASTAGRLTVFQATQPRNGSHGIR
jgi:hypothetical protein